MSTAASSSGGGSPDRGADPWAIVDAIKDVSRGVDVSGGLAPQDVLPGFGSRRFTCGDQRTAFCGDHAHQHETRTTCDRSTCPHCAPNWARRRATYVCRKLEALRAMLDGDRSSHQKHHHLSVSFQKKGEKFRFEGDDDDEIRNRLFQAAYDIMDELGIQGIVIYHPFVGRDGDDRGFWKDFLGSRTDWLEAREDLMHHPHVHIIGVSDFVEGGDITKTVEAETGWLIKRITRGGDDSDDNVSIGGKLDLARAVTYSLSHCGIYDTGEQMRYAGRWHGSDVNGAVVQEKYREQWERTVRTVAPKTLGLKKRDLLCSDRVTESSTQTSFGSFDAAQARMRSDTSSSSGTEGDDDFAGSNVDATGEVQIGSSGPVADPDAEIPDAPDVSVEVDIETRSCEAPLYDISRAPAFLSDEEWVEQAEYADELAETYELWRIGQDFLQGTDDDLQAIREERWDDVRIDLEDRPPPD